MIRLEPRSTLPKTLIRLTIGSGQGTVVFLPDLGGNVLYARNLVSALKEVDCFGTRLDQSMLENVSTTTVEALARRLAGDIEMAELTRPLHLAGFSFAGFVAFETARRLQALGSAADGLWLLDSHVLRKTRRKKDFAYLASEMAHALRYASKNWRETLGLTPDGNILHTYGLLRIDLSRHPAAYRKVIRGLYTALAQYTPAKWQQGHATLIRANGSYKRYFMPGDLGWGNLLDSCDIADFSGDHLSLLRDPASASQVGALIQRAFSNSILEQANEQ